MHSLRHNDKELIIKLNVEELTSTQIRLIKSMNALIANVLTCDEEAEYFEVSAQLMRKTAEIIKHSGYANHNNDMSYGEQAVEFAIDFLNEEIENGTNTNVDN
jgi:hypothetical protein